ncbi:2-hydroxyacid dehydrogenase [Pantanalinema rosaneae CENA516]|uniref:2-hydroxyacid dehydrogenase n=1 Tax=Pantanalinema rosaneae TaxID=1620701 RepID=UPI003D6F7D2C
MRVAVFSTKPYDREFLEAANTIAGHKHEFTYFEARLTKDTATLAAGYAAVCVFVNDEVTAEALKILAAQGTRLIALRCTGFNNVDVKAATQLGITIVRVVNYSPYSVAEHAVGLILTLNRKFHKAYNRVREGDFSLNGLLGFDLHGRTIGLVGTGKIGLILGQIMAGFGCKLLGYDLYPTPKFEAIGGRYVDLPELWAQSDIISLHCPLTPETHHIINHSAIEQMKSGVMLINPSRGALIDTEAVIAGLKSKKIGYLGIDVYEQEADLFFEDLSEEIIQDDVFQRLMTFPNVLVTAHQAFFTADAMDDISRTTIESLTDFEQGNLLKNELKLPLEKRPTASIS